MPRLDDEPRRAAPEDRALGLFTRTDAAADGIPDRLLSYRVHIGELRRLQRGVYLPQAFPVTPAVRARAALLTAAPGTVVGGVTAARLWGWAPAGDPAEQLVIPRGAGHRVRRADLRWLRDDLPPAAVVDIDGLAVTRRDRTLAQVLVSADELDAVWIADQSLRGRPGLVADVTGILDVDRRHRARRRLALADGRAESPLETALRMLLRRAGIDVVGQHPATDATGRVVARIDLAVPSARLAIEADGREFHSQPSALLRDRRRQNALMALGWIVLRFTWADIHDAPADVLSAVRGALVCAAPGSARRG